jgi:predicted nucleic acid-binding protein
MKYVLDSCVAFKRAVTEALSDVAIRLRDDFRNGVHELLTPDIFPFEIGHALTRAERQKRISIADGWAHWLAIMTDRPSMHPALPLMPRAYSISSAERIGVYDCLYVALAESENCELVTSDDKLIRLLQPKFPFLISLSALP